MQVDPFAAVAWRKRLLARLRRWLLTGSRPLRPPRLTRAGGGPPNLLILAVDTLRRDHLGLAGSPAGVSPAIDALAARGTDLAEVTAASPWTLSSFASSLTGLMPGLHGAHLAGPLRNMVEQPPGRLRGEATTLAMHLRRHGYRSASFHSNPFFAFGLAESFDRHAYLNLPADELAFLALDWVRRHADRPFFCHVLFNDPHEPTTPARRHLRPRLRELAARGIRPSPARLRELMRWGEVRNGTPYLGGTAPPLDDRQREALAIKLALYDAAIAQVDEAIGRCLEALHAWDLAETTLVVVHADHGEEFLDHVAEARRWNHDPRPLRGIGHGHSLFRELVHVPWLVAGPGVPAGARVDEPASLCDLAPTVTQWLGLPPLPLPEAGEGWCGRSLAPLAATAAQAAGAAGRPRPVAGPGTEAGGQAEAGAETTPSAAPGPGDRLLVCEDLAYGPDLVAVRRGAWKLMAWRDGRPLALYDLGADPRESRDQATARPGIAAGLLADLAAWRRSGPGGERNGTGERGWEEVADTVRRRLSDLGYTD